MTTTLARRIRRSGRSTLSRRVFFLLMAALLIAGVMLPLLNRTTHGVRTVADQAPAQLGAGEQLQVGAARVEIQVDLYPTLNIAGGPTGSPATGREKLFNGPLMAHAYRPASCMNPGWLIESDETWDKPVGIGDIDGDGKADLVCVNGNGDIWWYPGDETSDPNHDSGTTMSYVYRSASCMNPGWLIESDETWDKSVGVGDIDGNGKADLVCVNGNGDIWWYPGEEITDTNHNSGNTMSYQYREAGCMYASWLIESDETWDKSVGVGDIDGNGKADLVCVNGNGDIWWYPGEEIVDPNHNSGNTMSYQYREAGCMYASWLIESDETWDEPVGLGDVDGNGNADLVCVNGDGAIWWYPGDEIVNPSGGSTSMMDYQNRWATSMYASWLIESDETWDKPIGISNIDGIGNADLVCVNGNGDIWWYSGGEILSPSIGFPQSQICATAIVISNGTTKLCLVSCDVLALTTDELYPLIDDDQPYQRQTYLDDARNDINTDLDIPLQNIMFNATHSHNAPATANIHGTKIEEEFCQRTEEAIVEAASEAQDLLEPAVAYFACGTMEGLNLQEDENVPVLAFKDSGGDYIAVLFSQSGHADRTYNGDTRQLISPGLHGLAAQELEYTNDPTSSSCPDLWDTTVAFFSGCLGGAYLRDDNNPCETPDQVRLKIDEVKNTVKNALSNLQPINGVTLSSMKEDFTYYIREEPEEHGGFAAQNLDYFQDATAQHEALNVQMHRGEQRTTCVQTMRIGDVALVGLPGEMFPQYSVQIKQDEANPFEGKTLVFGLTNDYLGYIPYGDEGDYFVDGHWMYHWLTSNHSFAEYDTGDNLVGEALDMLQELGNTTPTATFSATPTSGTAPLTVNFTDQSTSQQGITARSWDFNNDGVVDSTAQNPSYQYSQVGTYTVKLTVTEADGDSDSEIKTNYITVMSTETSVAKWNMDEGTGSTISDSSGNGNDGTISGATWTTGKVGGGLSFDGVNDYVDCGNSSSLAVNDVSVEFWFNSAVKLEDNDGTNKVLVRKDGAWQVNYNSYYGLLFWYPDYPNNKYYRCTSTHEAGQWYHVAITWDDSEQQCKMYINGVAKSVGADSPGPIAHSNGPLLINPGGVFNGSMDEVAIYNRALSQTEIQQHYNADPLVVGKWSMNEGSGSTISDSSGHGNTGTINGATWTTGKVGGALSFDGVNDYVDCGNSSSLAVNDVSVEFWFNSAVKLEDNDGTNKVLVRKDGAWQVNYNSYYGLLFWYPDYPNNKYYRCTSTHEAGQWYHVAITWDDSEQQCKMYINGVAKSVGADSPGPIAHSNGPLLINPGGVFNGSMDEVAIYNRALSAAEIQQRYNAGTLVGSWHMDEASGSTIGDSSGNGNNGTISGATWTAGKVGSGLIFDGVDDYVDCGNASSLYPTNAISVFAWIRLDDNNPSEYPRVVSTLKYEGSSWKGYEIYQQIHSGAVHVQINVGGSFRSVYIGTPALGTWAYVGFTFDGTTIVPYFNGVAGSPVSAVGQITYPSALQSLRIGRNPNVGMDFKGVIDEVAICYLALSAAEIQQRYNSGA